MDYLKSLLLLMPALLLLSVAGCASDPRSTRGATANTYCGGLVWGTVDAAGNVACPDRE